MSGAGKKAVSLLDVDVPDIGVVPLTPTKYQAVLDRAKQTLGKFVKKNAYDIADWILNLTPNVVKRVLPQKIVDLIELSKRVDYRAPPSVNAIQGAAPITSSKNV